jgi:large subunit ribosomal protein L21
MYAVIETGGKQYKVTEGMLLKVEKLDVPEGESLEINKVLLINKDGNLIVGTPYLENASVKATVIETKKDKKILVFKKKPRKGFKRLRGHRQYYTKLKIETINYGG